MMATDARRARTSAIFAALLASCTGTETGNPYTAELSASAYSRDPGIAVGAGSGVVVESAWIALDAVRFFPETSCTDAAHAEDALSAPLAIELVAGASPGAFELTHARYCRAEVRVHPVAALPAGAPPELEGQTIVARGTRADGTAFVVVSGAVPVIDLQPTAGAIDVAAAAGPLLLAFDMAEWLAGVDLAGATVSPDGIVHVDASSNAALLSIFDANVARSGQLFDDAAGDGHVDTSDPVLASHHP